MIDAFLQGIGFSAGVFAAMILYGLFKKPSQPDLALEELKTRNELTRDTNSILERIANEMEGYTRR